MADPPVGWPAAAAASDPRLRFTVRAVEDPERAGMRAEWTAEATIRRSPGASGSGG